MIKPILISLALASTPAIGQEFRSLFGCMDTRLADRIVLETIRVFCASMGKDAKIYKDSLSVYSCGKDKVDVTISYECKGELDDSFQNGRG